MAAAARTPVGGKWGRRRLPAHRSLIDSLSSFVQENLNGAAMAAAHDPLHKDLRQVQATIDEHVQWIDAIDAKHTSIAEQVDRLARGHADTAAGQQTLSETVGVLSERTRALAESLEPSMARLVSRVENLGAQFDTTAKMLTGSAQELNAALGDFRSEVGGHFRRIETTCQHTAADCKAASQALRGELDDRLNGLAATIAQDQLRWLQIVARLEERLGSLEPAVDTLPNIAAEAPANRAAIDALSRWVQGEIAERLDDLSADLRTVDGFLNNHGVALAAVKSDLKGPAREMRGRRWTAHLALAVAWLGSIGSDACRLAAAAARLRR